MAPCLTSKILGLFLTKRRELFLPIWAFVRAADVPLLVVLMELLCVCGANVFSLDVG